QEKHRFDQVRRADLHRRLELRIDGRPAMSSTAADELSNRPQASTGSTVRPAPRPLTGLAAATAWLAAALLTGLWPDLPESDWGYPGVLAIVLGVIAAAIPLAIFAETRFAAFRRVQTAAPWLLALALSLPAWEAITAKLGLLPLPFFPPPQAIL